MVLRKTHRIAVVRLARHAATLPPRRFIARERIFAPMMMRSRQTGSAAGLAQFPVILNHLPSSRVVAGLVPATSILLALCSDARDRRDKPGDDSGK
jgi:hypothetical protein